MDILKNKKILIGAAVAVVVLIVVIILLSNAYKTPLNNYVDVMYKGKFDKIEKMAPKEYWDWFEETYKKSADEYIDELKENKDDYMEELEEIYGDNIKVSYKITDKKELSKKKIENIAEVLSDKYDIKESSVKKGYNLEYEMTVKGSEDDTETEGEITVIKIGMTWYLVNYRESGGKTYVNFVAGF